MSASSQYYSVTARVGVPHRHEVEVTVPLVGPAGATGPAGAAGASAWNDITGKPSTFAPSAHSSSHHTGGSDPLAPANIGAAKDFTEIEVGNTGTSTTTLTTAQLPARVILFLDASGEVSATINLPTPDARQSGLSASIKVQRESGTTDSALITVVHSGTTLLYIELAEAEGSITFVWDGYEWSYSNKFFFANFAGRNLLLPATSGTLALTESADNVFRVVGSSDATKKVAFEVDTNVPTASTVALTVPAASGTIALTTLIGTPCEFIVACSDEATNLTTGTAKVTFRAPHAFTLTGVRSSVNTAPTGSTLIVDINEGGTSVLSTKLSIDASEKTSTTAATAAVISDSAIADDAEITIDIDQIGSTIAGKGLKVTLSGTRA